MKARYTAWQQRTPRCDLPGSPFPSRRQAIVAAHRAGIADPRITAVRRRPA